MSVILYTQEELEAFVTRASCCASNQAYKALRAAQVKGKNTCEQNKHNYLEMAICALGNYTATGTVISEAVTPHAAIAATCVINFFDLFGNTLFLTLETSIGGVIVYPQASYTIGTSLADYASLQDFVDAFVLYINTDVSSPDYTATNVGTTVTLTAVTAGVSVNGMITNMLGEAIRFTSIDIYKFNPIALMSPCFGCYDPNKDEIIFTGYDADDVYILDPTDNSITFLPVPSGYRTYDIMYNPILQRKYITLPTTQSLYRIDSANNVVPGFLSTGHNVPWRMVYNPIGGASYPSITQYPNTSFAVGCNSEGIANYFVVYDANSETIIHDINLGAGVNIKAISYNPQAGSYLGYYYFVAYSTGFVYMVSPAGVLTSFATTVTQPLSCPLIEIGLGTGVYEVWVFGNSLFIERFTEDGTLLGTIPLPIVPTPLTVIQNPLNGYVYMASNVANLTTTVIRPTDLKVILLDLDFSAFIEGAYGNVAHPDGRVYYGMPFDGKIVELTTTEDVIDDDYVFSGGEDEVTEEIPAVIVTEDDGTNCLTQEEAYIIIENVKKICGCCCEFEDDILQKDISATQ